MVMRSPSTGSIRQSAVKKSRNRTPFQPPTPIVMACPTSGTQTTTPLRGHWVNPQGIGRMLGDMDGDGRLTSADALMILKAAVGRIDL